MIQPLRIACREGVGQSIAEYALILAMILVLVAGGIRFFAYLFTGQ